MAVEIIGYAGSILVAVSLIMASILWLRIINLVGAVFFVVYAAVIGALPVLLTNGFIVLVDIYYLVRIMRSNTSGFSYVPIDEKRRGPFTDFVDRYRNDINKYYPLFSSEILDRELTDSGIGYLALRNLRIQGFSCYLPVADLEHDMIPADMLEYINGELYPDRSVFMTADYITVKYRGLGLVTRLYNRLLEELPSHISFLIVAVSADSRGTRRFLERNGHILQREFGSLALYVKTLR